MPLLMRVFYEYLYIKSVFMKKKFTSVMLLLALSAGVASAQTSKVTGKVVGEDGEPVIGASVIVKGTTIGTVTDFDGNFSLEVPSDGKQLVVSYVGMKKTEVQVAPRVSVTMQSDAQDLDEVVVTAYGTSTKGAFTGSASVMKAETIEKRLVSNVTNALAGSVAGVQIISDNGQPGETAKVRIRGVGSINAGTEPLYVVDGIPYDGDLSSINSTDIESMTVLKDAASTALYGARGANGIIMITTKKGKSGKARVNFDAKWGANSRAVGSYDVLTDPNQYMEYAYQALNNAALYNLGYDAAKANAYANSKIFTGSGGGLGYQVYTLPEGESMFGMDGKINPNAKLGYSDGTYYYTPDNWQKEMFKTKLRQEYNLSISGGNEKSSLYFSFGYLDDQGIIEGSGFRRFSGRVNGDYKVTDWFKVGANMSYINSNSRYPSDQDGNSTASSGNAFFLANNIAPIYPMYVRGTDGNIMMNNGRRVYDFGDGVSTNMDRPWMSIANPLASLIYDKQEYLADIVNTSWYGELTPLKGLTLTARFGVNVDNTRYNSLGNAYMGQSAQYGGLAWQEQTRDFGFDQQYIGNYQFSFNDVNHMDITVGYDGYNYEQTYVFASGQNLYNPESYYVSNAIDNLRGGGHRYTYATRGYFGRVNYSYDEKYIGNVSFRRDASSRFAPENRWGNFWSASAAWVISKEDFMKDLTWVDMLKLKASFGQQGNDNILKDLVDMDPNYYPYLDQFGMTGANGVFSDGALKYKGNRDITWETSTSYNVGVEFALWQKFNGSVEYFGRRSGDMLYNKPVAGSNGYTYIPMNVGSMTNSGVEFDLSYNIYNNKNVTWDVNLNATFLKNKINELSPDLNGKMIDGTRIYEEGKSMYRMYLVDYAGVDEKTGEALYWAKDENGQAIKTTDYSAATDYKVATDDLLPTVYGGFGTSVTAYGFDASVQFSYQLGGQVYDAGYYRVMHNGYSSGTGANWHKDMANAWTPTNTHTDIPRLDANDQFGSSQSTRWMVSSNYLSINNITLGYTLPKSLTEKFQVEKLRFYFVADNVGVISARKGLDPRQSYTSVGASQYAPIRTISGGINLTF